MPKGETVKAGAKLVPYNTRMAAEMKALLDALVKVQKLPGGQRELIERMLAAYETKYPADVGRAREIVALLVPSE